MLDKPIHLVIYTVLLGDKEELGSPLSLLNKTDCTDLTLDFICFTDNKELISDTWRFIYLESKNLPPERYSRRPKALPHEYLQDWDYSLYIDNIVTFKRLPNSKDLETNNPYLFKVFLHAFRENILQESDAIATLGYDDVKVLDNQLNFYTSVIPIDTIKPIHTCTVILREHHNPNIIQQGILWWETFLCFSKRDQMSFDFAIKQSSCIIEAFPGFKHENDIINGINNAHDNRIKANFDKIKYSWLNRKVPEAINNPKAHFLANTSALGEDYAKETHLFEHICNRMKSSLGHNIAPRRGVSNIFDQILKPYKGKGGNCLVVRVRDTKNTEEFLEEEFATATQSISMFLNPFSIKTFELSPSELIETQVAFKQSEELFDITILFGLRPEQMVKALQKFIGLLNPNHGNFSLLTTKTSQLDIITQTSELINTTFSVNCSVSISHSKHDNFNKLIANSFIYFEW